MDIKRYVVTAVDFDADGQSDGKPRVLAVCKSEDEAKHFITEDMQEYADEHAGSKCIIDPTAMRATDTDACNGREWNFEAVEIELADDEVLTCQTA